MVLPDDGAPGRASGRDGEEMSGAPSETEREWRAHIANMRQELLSPIAAIVGYAELLLEDAKRSTQTDYIDDVERIHTAAADLSDLLDKLLPADGVSELERNEALESELRHDLRNPLGAIKGYAELLLEESEEQDGGFGPDLTRLLLETDMLLAQIDRIVDFSGVVGEKGRDSKGDGAASTIATALMRSIKPVDSAADEPHLTGRILVVDDNASNRDLLHRRLSHDGHQVETVASGEQALDRMAAETFDLVLLDLLMPGLNGFEVLQRLKADERFFDIPVIMISGLRETDSVIRCIEAGAEDYLAKPFNPVVLRARLKSCLERKCWRDRERRYLEQIEMEKAKHEALLHNILPGDIVARLNNGEVVIADRFDDATILFADLVGFTAIAATMPAAELVEKLNRIFSEFDRLCHTMGIEKIKTIGDAYMAVSGLPERRSDHASAIAEFARAMLVGLKAINVEHGTSFELRVGIHTGPVIAGVIGKHRFLYDVWGESVNLASRMESHGEPGRIHVSDQTKRALAGCYAFEDRGPISVKGIGHLETAFLIED